MFVTTKRLSMLIIFSSVIFSNQPLTLYRNSSIYVFSRYTPGNNQFILFAKEWVKLLTRTLGRLTKEGGGSAIFEFLSKLDNNLALCDILTIASDGVD